LQPEPLGSGCDREAVDRGRGGGGGRGLWGRCPSDVLEASAVQAEVQLWVEVVTLAARGNRVCQSVAEKVVDEWVAWLARRLDPSSAAGA
jgi:hypothetical protein